MRVLPQPATADLELACVLHALGDPVRLELLRLLYMEGEITCAPRSLDIPKSTLSNHWRILREAGITTTVADGRTRRMSLRRADLDRSFPGLIDTILQVTAAIGA